MGKSVDRGLALEGGRLEDFNVCQTLNPKP